VIRPGPDHIGAGAAPGGLVVHVYDTRDGRLVTFAPVPAVTAEQADAIGAANAEEVARLLPAGTDVCLVFYDGDTGARMVPPWA
jgi:hypothetical protein